MTDRHIVVAGATGLVGRAAMEHFVRRNYETTATARRRPFDTYGAAFISADLGDEIACRNAFSGLSGVTQIVYAALFEEPDLVAGWTQQSHVDRNERMLRNLVEAIAPNAPTLRNITILQGPKAYGGHVKRLRPDCREDRDEDRSVLNFYWAQEDYLKSRQIGQSWSWTILRPSLVVGMAIGGAMNLLAAIGVYAALLKAQGEPLHFPGHRGSVFQPTDTDLIAHAVEWAGQAESARNQIFNIDNGELFSLADQWPVIAECFGMRVGEDVNFSFLDGLPERAGEWDAIRRLHDLTSPALTDFLGQSIQFADWVFARNAQGAPETISTIKIRRAGFNETVHSDEMFRKWFARYHTSRLLPLP